MVKNVKNEGRIGKSNQEAITFAINADNQRTKQQQLYKNYRRADFVEMRRRMQATDWNEVLAEKDVNVMWNSIRGQLDQLADELVPNSRVKTRNDPKWFTNEIKRSIAKKKKAWTEYKRTKTERDKDAYRQLGKEMKNKIKNAKNKLEREVIRDAKTNPRRFYAYINSARKVKSKIGPLKRPDGEIVVDHREQAELLNKYFASEFTKSENKFRQLREKWCQS